MLINFTSWLVLTTTLMCCFSACAQAQTSVSLPYTFKEFRLSPSAGKGHYWARPVSNVTKSSITLRVPIAESKVMLEAVEQGADAQPRILSNSYVLHMSNVYEHH